MGPKEFIMMAQTLVVGAGGAADGAAGGAAGGAKKKQSTGSGGPAGGGAKKQKVPAAVEGVDEEPINGYPTPETMEALTLQFLEAEKARYKAKGSKLIVPVLEKDKKAMYEKLGLRCQQFCEEQLSKKKGDLDLSIEFFECLLEQYHCGDMQYYKDRDGTEYKDLSQAPCWFCREKCTAMFKHFCCDWQKKGSNPAYNTICDKISCTKCAPQGEHFNEKTDSFYCPEHNNDKSKKEHEEATKKQKVVNPLMSVYDIFHQPKEEVKLSVFRTIGGDRVLTQKYMRTLFDLKKSEVPSEAMYEIAASATAEAGAVPKITVFTKQNVKAPPESKIKLTFLPETSGHFWYADFNGIEISKKKFFELLTDKKNELSDDIDKFKKLKKKVPSVAVSEKDKKRLLELDLLREEIAEECDMVYEIMRIGKRIIEQNEWKALNVTLTQYWTDIEQLTILAPVPYDEEVPDDVMQAIPMADEDLCT